MDQALFRQLIDESRKILDNPRVNEKDARGEYTSYAKKLRAKARSLLNRADQLLLYDELPKKRKIK